MATVKEENTPFEMTGRGVLDVNSEEVRDNINVLLNSVTAQNFPNPYVALERVKKVLANFHIFLDKTNYMTTDHGYEVWPVKQFGDKAGMDDDGQYKVAESNPYFVFFEYAMNDRGSFTVYCELVDESDLNELKDAINSEEQLEEKVNYKLSSKVHKYKQSAESKAREKKFRAWRKKFDRDTTSFYDTSGQHHEKTSRRNSMYEDMNEMISRTPHTDAYHLWKQRKRRRLGEETEQLDELSRDTMNSYKRAAERDKRISQKMTTDGPIIGDSDNKRRNFELNRLRKRMRGAKLLAKKDLGENEQLDELYGKGKLNKIRDYWQKKSDQKYNKLEKHRWARLRGNKEQPWDKEKDGKMKNLADRKVIRADALIDRKNWKQKQKKLRKSYQKYMDENWKSANSFWDSKAGEKAQKKAREYKDNPPFDADKEKSTPWKNPKSKAKQLARKMMRKYRDKIDEASGAKLGAYVTKSKEWMEKRGKKNKETHEKMKQAFRDAGMNPSGLGGPVDSKLYRRERARKLALKKLAGEGGVKVSAKE